jgi:hypothetical protein
MFYIISTTQKAWYIDGMKRNIAVVLGVLIVIVALLPQTRRWAATYLANLPEASSEETLLILPMSRD